MIIDRDKDIYTDPIMTFIPGFNPTKVKFKELFFIQPCSLYPL